MATVENLTILKLKRRLQQRFPGFLTPGMKIAASSFLFKKERRYFRNVLSTEEDFLSVVLLSQPRGGTQICQEIIGDLIEERGGLAVNIGKYWFWKTPQKVIKLTDEAWAWKNLKDKGFFFGNFGPFHDVSKLPLLKYIVMCRDPRDVLLSHYYSIRDAHVLNSTHMTEMSQFAKNSTIDEYVLSEQMVSDVRLYLTQAIQFQKSSHQHLFIRYEDMMSNPAVFISKIGAFVGAEKNSDECEKLAEYYFPFIPGDTEATFRHRRSGSWGQFKSKLKPETVTQLNELFKEELTQLGYFEEEFLHADASAAHPNEGAE